MSYYEQILSPSQLKRLEKHQYSAQSQSILDPYMQKWWNLVVEWVPLWMAPNLITMVGLLCNVVTSVILMIYCPTATEPAPGWTTLFAALGLFIYQTLDAIDGKQARRTGSQSPLGELFDHGCDSLSTVFVTLASCCATSLGFAPTAMVYQCFVASTLFYCAHWQTYVTGTMRFGKIDVTEGQMCVIVFMLMSTIFGPSVWDYNVLGLIPLRMGPTIFGTVFGGIALIVILGIIAKGGAGKNGSTVAGTSVISPIIPLLLVIAPGLVLASNSSENLFEDNAILFVITFGLMASKVTNKLIVAHMTKSEMNMEDITLLVPVAFCLKWYFNITVVSGKTLLAISCIFVSLDLVLYCRQVCLEICDHLNVELFRIKPPKKKN